MRNAFLQRLERPLKRIHGRLVTILLAVLIAESIAGTRAAETSFTDSNSMSTNAGIPGVNGEVYAATVDYQGNLYIGGDFSVAGAVVASRIAKWDGTEWAALGAGMNGTVCALAISGNDLYAAGRFTTAGTNTAANIAKWDGNSWSALGSGVNGEVRALTVVGGDVYAGGQFTTAGLIAATNVAKWDGIGWSGLGFGLEGRPVYALAALANNVYAGSDHHVAKWDGSSWSALGSDTDLWGQIRALAVSEGSLFAGGNFTTVDGSVANGMAKWDGSSWLAVGVSKGGSKLGSGMDGVVCALAVSGSNVYAGGLFIMGDLNPVANIVEWDGTGWSGLGSGINSAVRALAVSGSDLYVGGYFTMIAGARVNHIAKWNDTSWPNFEHRTWDIAGWAATGWWALGPAISSGQ